MLTSIRSMVRKAARLAVYDEVTINAKNHQRAATNRVDISLEIRGILMKKKNAKIA